MRIKEDYPDSILLFRLGDFYEMFYDDAKLASSILDITLTSRNKNDPNTVPLCGVPYHSVEPYISRLLENGKKVAICDQMEDPKLAKGIVRREVTRVITPGMVPDGLGLTPSSNNFLASIVVDADKVGFAVADISTGLFQAAELESIDLLIEELGRADPKEIVLTVESPAEKELADYLRRHLPSVLLTPIDRPENDSVAFQSLQGGAELKASLPIAARAASAVLHYLNGTQKGRTAQIISIRPYSISNIMRLDDSSIRNLELLKTMLDGERSGSLLGTLDKTSTSLGARKLKRWLLYPLTDPTEIGDRLNAVEQIMTSPESLRELPEIMGDIYDLERITGRIGAGAANARDLAALSSSLESAARLKSATLKCNGLLAMLRDSIDPCDELMRKIVKTIVDEPPGGIRDGGLIRSGVSEELDELRDVIANGKGFIASLEAKERERTGIGSLKIRFNKVFGYYLEVTNTHRDKVPDDFIRKQTLSNAERYATPELKEYEEKVLGAQEKVRALEYDIFSSLRDCVAQEIARLQGTADAIASIDVLLAFARLAAENDYCRPLVDNSTMIEIGDGRHPIVERLNPLERFVPNDVSLDGSDNRLLMITGPNMAGKSTVMRQTALIVLMAQMGSFVPATSAKIGVVDRIFTRVGASDALSKGQSTFMVEMSETAAILRSATRRSLIIIDEIGRGTSTFDGLAIAWSVAEEIHDRIGARTMFATHYHELTELALTKPGIRNMQIAVKEWNGDIVFLRKLIPGGTSRSYGIQVARLAGLPTDVIERAYEVLENLEEGELDEVGQPRIAIRHASYHGKEGPAQFQLFTKPVPGEIVAKLQELDTSVITPIEALNILHELKQKI